MPVFLQARKDLGIQRGGLVLLAAARFAGLLEDMLVVARRAASLLDGFLDDRNDRVVRDAAFAWTVVVHDVAKTQRPLLHLYNSRVEKCLAARQAPSRDRGHA